jgi:hypothetical protein
VNGLLACFLAAAIGCAAEHDQEATRGDGEGAKYVPSFQPSAWPEPVLGNVPLQQEHAVEKESLSFSQVLSHTKHIKKAEKKIEKIEKKEAKIEAKIEKKEAKKSRKSGE